MKWTSQYVNDPGDDYELVVEILCDEKDVGLIRYKEQGIELTWFSHKTDLVVPVEWLIGVLNRANKDLKRG